MVRVPLTPEEHERGERLGTLLRRARGEQGLVEVATASGISPETLRKIEAGTYERHRFKARLHGSAAPPAPAPAPGAGATPKSDLYQEYVDARLACGQNAKGITREKLEKQLDKQRTQLQKKFGNDAEFQFRVAVEGGKVRLKARRVGA